MKRRTLLKTGAALAAAGMAGCQPKTARTGPVTQGSPSRPNILMIVTDQQRHWLDIPKEIPLPGHEWLLKRGRGFVNHHVHTTPCSPSRSTIYTGQHTQFTGMTSNHGAPPYPEMKPVKTIGHLLREQGYYTAYKGKWHLSHVPEGGNLGYGPYASTRDVLEPYGFSDYNDDGDPHGITWTGYKYDPQTASSSAHWLHTQGKSLRGQQPWFLAVNFTNPHDVMYFDDVDGAQTASRLSRDYLAPLSAPPVDGVYTQPWDLPLPASYYRDDLSTKPWAQQSYVGFCDMVYGEIKPKDERRWRAYQSYYFNCIRDADRHLLTVVQALEQSGQLDNTVILFTADHGEMAGAHGLRQKGAFMYKENMRVPHLLVHPDVKQPGLTAALSSPLDFVPTLLACAGVSDDQRATRYPELKGINLLPVMADASARTERDQRGILFDYNTSLYLDPAFAREAILAGGAHPLGMLRASISNRSFGPNLDNPGFFRGVHDGRYKFARYFAPSQHHTPTDWKMLTTYNQLELYDTQNDPDEIVNLATKPEIHQELLLKLNAQTNALVAHEIGEDLGAEHIGPAFLYDL